MQAQVSLESLLFIKNVQDPVSLNTEGIKQLRTVLSLQLKDLLSKKVFRSKSSLSGGVCSQVFCWLLFGALPLHVHTPVCFISSSLFGAIPACLEGSVHAVLDSNSSLCFRMETSVYKEVSTFGLLKQMQQPFPPAQYPPQHQFKTAYLLNILICVSVPLAFWDCINVGATAWLRWEQGKTGKEGFHSFVG